jgi:hypothetical protein
MHAMFDVRCLMFDLQPVLHGGGGASPLQGKGDREGEGFFNSNDRIGFSYFCD